MVILVSDRGIDKLCSVVLEPRECDERLKIKIYSSEADISDSSLTSKVTIVSNLTPCVLII